MAEEAESIASQKQNCIFCRIIEGKIPSKVIYSDDICMAILDINPMHVGHTLIIPKEHYQIMPQVPEKYLKHLFKVSKHVSNAMLKNLGVKGTSIFVANGAAAGQKAPHFMIHVIPRKQNDGLFQIIKRKVSESDIEKIQEIIIKRLSEKIGRACVVLAEKKQGIEKKSKKDNIVDAEVVEDSAEAEQENVCYDENIDEEQDQQQEAKEGRKEKSENLKKAKPQKREKTTKKGSDETVNIDDIANMFL